MSTDLIELVRELCRRAGRTADDPEIRAALEKLSAGEEAALRKAGRGQAPARPLGPRAWMDVVRGVPPAVAAARELGGYYTLLAERDALAAMLGPRKPDSTKDARAPREAPAAAAQRTAPAKSTSGKASSPPRTASGKGAAPRSAVQTLASAAAIRPLKRRPPGERETPASSSARADHLLGLFAYHRDAPLVARALGMPLGDLENELDALNLRRRAYRLVRGVDADMPAATAIRGALSGPSVRRRTKAQAASVKEAPREAPLAALLREVGPRRPLLAERLGAKGQPLSDGELLARFSAEGLDRALADAERKLLHELVATHRGSTPAAAQALGVSPERWKTIVVERGLSRQLIALRDRYRKEAREQTWPRNRIEQVLHHRKWLEELGLWDELFREVSTRVRLMWKGLAGSRAPLDDLQHELRLNFADARDLQRLLDLR